MSDASETNGPDNLTPLIGPQVSRSKKKERSENKRSGKICKMWGAPYVAPTHEPIVMLILAPAISVGEPAPVPPAVVISVPSTAVVVTAIVIAVSAGVVITT